MLWDRLIGHCSTGFRRWRRDCVGRLPYESAAFTSLFEFAIPLGVDGVAASGENVVRGDVADSAVQADGVVMEDEAAHNAIGIGFGERCLHADGVVF